VSRVLRLAAILLGLSVLATGCSGPPPLRPEAARPTRLHRFRARVRDRAGQTYGVREALAWSPETSLLGTDKGEERDFLRILPAGSKDTDKPVSVNLEEVTTLVLEELDEVPTRLLVTVQFRGTRTGKQFVGTVRSNLELRGRYDETGFACRVPLRRIAELALEPEQSR
jgi:hypothetical protein